MMKRSSFQEKRLTLFLVSVTFLHLVALTLTFTPSWETAVEGPPKEVKPIALKVIEIRRDRKQIVASEEPDTSESPTDAKFLSDKDRRFDRETRAKTGTTFQRSQYGGSQGMATKEIKLSDLGLKTANPYRPMALRDRHPTSTETRRLSTTSDFLADIPLGDVTHLNTKEFKYYGFYQRIRQKLEQFWGRSIQEAVEELLRKGRRVPASEHLITSLVVTLDANGEITAIKVTGPSGMREMDDAAIESFNQAGPFPNPPKDLIVNGKVVIEWGFVVQS